MPASFVAPATLDFFCRHCQKIAPAQLDRSIAGNGRTVDKDSTFEYCCTKCLKTFCISGNDVIEADKVEQQSESPKEYAPADTFGVGEVIHHKKFNEKGTVVGKVIGSPNRIIVSFKKAGVRKLVEGA